MQVDSEGRSASNGVQRHADPETFNAPSVGGKAAGLIRLLEQGFPVPDFEVSPPNLAEAVERLGFPLVVRSSATGEDGKEASFAGQFESYLNLRTLEEVQTAVENCRQSVQYESVRQYCRRQGVDADSLRMQVIVQRMIQPDLSGVAFTCDPATGRDHVVIEACLGLGDSLLAGKQDSLPEEHPQFRRHRPAIETMALEIQRHFGCPQDIEFAIEHGKLFVLQARPVTRIQFSEQIGEWTNADFRDGGVSSTVCSPLMWSLYEMVWDRTLKDCLHEIHLRGEEFLAGQMFFGRPYWNLGAVKQRVSRLPGFVEREFDQDLSVESTYEGDGIVTPLTWYNVARAIPTVLTVNRFIHRQVVAAEAFVRDGYAPIDAAGRNDKGDMDASFRKLIEQDYWQLESCYFRTIFALSLAKLDFKMSFPDAHYAELVAGLPPLSHMAPQRRIREMQRQGSQVSARIDITRLTEEFAHHCRFGIDVCHPRWDEDQAFVRSLVQAELEAPTGSPACRDDAARHLPKKFCRGRARRKLKRLRRLIWLREEMRDLSNRMYYHIRRHALEIGTQRFLDNDVFFMTFQQIWQHDASELEAAKDIYRRFRHYNAPHEIGCRFDRKSEPISSATILRGIAASQGVAEGRVYVARSVDEALRAPAGAILICPFTEPGWTPVLGRVAAVVTETGGLLSHAAVICREYGIPAVLAVTQATTRLREGATVAVDGRRGTVCIRQEPSS